MTRPDPFQFQQLVLGGSTGPYDCAAWSGAWLDAAHNGGPRRVTGRQVRLMTNEPIPDPASPGLNLPQVDAALVRLTKLDLDTRLMGRIQAQALIVDGRWAHVQINRAVLVSRGVLTGFRGAHSITVHAEAGVAYIGDPLVPRYVRAKWDDIWDAAESFGAGWVRLQFTRDFTPDYRAHLNPIPPAKTITYAVYKVRDGRIVPGGKGTSYVLRTTKGSGRPLCTPPRLYRWGTSTKYVRLVRLTDGAHTGEYVAAKYAKEIVP